MTTAAEFTRKSRITSMNEEKIKDIIPLLRVGSTLSLLEQIAEEKFENRKQIPEIIEILLDFYNADCVVIIQATKELKYVEIYDEVHHNEFVVPIDTKCVKLAAYPETLRQITKNKAFCAVDAISGANTGSQEQKRMVDAGINSFFAMPWKTSTKDWYIIAVINPRDEKTHSSVICYAAYMAALIIRKELSEQKENLIKESQSYSLAENEVYVKLLNGFELHTHTGIATEKSIGRKQGVLFLILLLTQRGQILSANSLLNLLWDDPDMLDVPERALKNLSYNVRKNIRHLFVENDFLEIKKAGYAFNSKYTVITDLDVFSKRLHDVNEITDQESRLRAYIDLLNRYNGTILPQHSSRVVVQFAEKFKMRRHYAQNESLVIMHNLEFFGQMHEFIGQVSVARGWDADLSYWDIKALIGMRKFVEARATLKLFRDMMAPHQLNELAFLEQTE